MIGLLEKVEKQINIVDNLSNVLTSTCVIGNVIMLTILFDTGHNKIYTYRNKGVVNCYNVTRAILNAKDSKIEIISVNYSKYVAATKRFASIVLNKYSLKRPFKLRCLTGKLSFKKRGYNYINKFDK